MHNSCKKFEKNSIFISRYSGLTRTLALALIPLAIAFLPNSSWSQTAPKMNRKDKKYLISPQKGQPIGLKQAWTIRLSAPAGGLVGEENWLAAYSKVNSTITYIKLLDGQIRWQTRPFLGALSTPVKWNDQVLLVPNSSVLQALDESTGEVAWQLPFISKNPRYPESTTIYSGFNPPLTSPNEVLWLDTLGRLWSLNASHQLRVVADFRSAIGDSSRFLSQPTLVNTALVACSQRGTLTSVNLKTAKSSLLGSLSQQASGLTGKLSITTHPQAIGNRLIIASEDGTLFGHSIGDPKGSWVKTFGRGSDTFSPSGELLFSPLLLSDQTANPGIVVARRNRIERVNSERGDRIWSIPLKESLLYPPVLGPNQTIVAATSSELLIMSWNGAILKRASIPAGLCSAPLVINEAIYLAFTDSTVSRYDL